MHDARDRNQGLWIGPGDRLYVAAYSSVASLVVRFSGYWRKANGDVSEYTVTVNPTSDRAVTAQDVFFGAGFLLSCVASLASGNANRGQCYVRAHIQRGTGTPAVKLAQVLGGYLTDNAAPSFPYGKLEGPLDGQGIIRSITGTDPAAGAELSEAVPTGARWHLKSLRVVLVTSAVAGNRQILLKLDDGTTLLWHGPVILNQAASTTNNYVWFAPTIVNTTAGYAIQGPLPGDVKLLAGWRVLTQTVGLDVGDDYAAPQLHVEEWLEA